MDRIQKSTGLSKLELLGIIAEMNKIWECKIASLRKYEEDEQMGRNI